jgi:hypothetical protein
MIDLILHAADGQTLIQFARTYNLFRKNADTVITDDDPDSPTFGDVLETIDNGWRQRRGFEYSPWAGSGKFLSANKQLRTSIAVDQSTATEFAFNIGSSTPAWLDTTVTAEANGEIIGTYTRKQGNFAVFTSTGTSPTVGATLDVYTQAEYLDGLVYLVRFSGSVADDDVADYDETETDQAAKSKIVRWAKRNGTIGSTGGGDLDFAEVDGVKIFQPDQVNTWLETRGLPGHIWQGGNNY